MRRNLVAFIIITIAASASADDKTIDISEIRDKLTVLHDGSGHYFVVSPLGDADATVFYGNGTDFYAQSLGGRSGSAKAKNWLRSVWSPTSPDGAVLRDDNSTWSVTCDNSKTLVSLSALGAKETDKILKKAVFHPRVWNRSIRLLARDEDANYYIVDSKAITRSHDATIFELRDVNVYVGPAGRMKRLSVSELASDAQGFVIVSKEGTVITDNEKNGTVAARWRPASKKKKKEAEAVQLKVVDAAYSMFMIFSTLGVYPARTGTPCDDLYVASSD